MISLALLSAALGEVTMPISPAWPAQVVVPNSLASIPGNSQFAPGVTDLTLVADADPVPDTIALVATISQDGVVRIPASTGIQLFAVATANVGATGSITVSADTGDQALPLALTVCETDGLGGCIAPATPSVTVAFEAGTTRSFALLASAGGSIALDPGLNRIFTRLRDASGTTRGSTSAAVCTAPNANC